MEDTLTHIKGRIEKVEDNISAMQEDLNIIKTDNAVIKNNIQHILDKLNGLNCNVHITRLEKHEQETKEKISILEKTVSNFKTVWGTVIGGGAFAALVFGLVEYVRGAIK